MNYSNHSLEGFYFSQHTLYRYLTLLRSHFDLGAQHSWWREFRLRRSVKWLCPCECPTKSRLFLENWPLLWLVCQCSSWNTAASSAGMAIDKPPFSPGTSFLGFPPLASSHATRTPRPPHTSRPSLTTSPHASFFTVLIIRDDRKPFPFNIFPKLVIAYPLLKSCIPDSNQRNSRGTVISAQVPQDQAGFFAGTVNFASVDGIKFTVHRPTAAPKHVGEVVFDFSDMEDKSLLSLTPQSLRSELCLPSSAHPGSNTILSVRKLYPSQPVNDPSTSPVRTMRIAVVFSEAIPDRLCHHHVALRVVPHVPPPSRCGGCQRFGHGSISCCRTPVCSRCALPGHDGKQCTAAQPKCASCYGPHRSSHVRCPVYIAAQQIHSQSSRDNLPRSTTGRLYANLYSAPSPTRAPPVDAPARHPRASPPTTAASPSVSSRPPTSLQTLASTAKRQKISSSPPTPFHLTLEYMAIVHGDPLNDSLGSLPSLSPPSSNPFTENDGGSSAPSSSLRPPAHQSFTQLLLDLFSKLLRHAALYLQDLLSAEPGPLSSLLQPLLTSLVGLLAITLTHHYLLSPPLPCLPVFRQCSLRGESTQLQLSVTPEVTTTTLLMQLPSRKHLPWWMNGRLYWLPWVAKHPTYACCLTVTGRARLCHLLQSHPHRFDVSCCFGNAPQILAMPDWICFSLLIFWSIN